MLNFQALIKLLRPHQYIKNTFIFIGVLFGHQWKNPDLTQALIVFIAFCICSSAVYVLNDIIDVEADRAHPRKSKRPLPSGQLSLTSAKYLFVILILIAISISLLISQLAILLLGLYILINIAYSFYLKHTVILDVFTISAGFMLRILAGTIGLGIAPSAWLLLCGMMLTLFLGFCKRTTELIQMRNTHEFSTRKVLEDYSPALLEQLTAVTAACTIIGFALYTVSPQTIKTHNTDSLIYTLPIVAYGIFRYLYLIHQYSDKGTDTAKDLFTDIHMLLSVLLWLLLTMSLLV